MTMLGVGPVQEGGEGDGQGTGGGSNGSDGEEERVLVVVLWHVLRCLWLLCVCSMVQN